MCVFCAVLCVYTRDRGGLDRIGPVEQLVLELDLEAIGGVGQHEQADRVVVHVLVVGREVGAQRVVAARHDVLVRVARQLAVLQARRLLLLLLLLSNR